MSQDTQDELQRRRGQLCHWLLKVWEWSLDHHRPTVAETAAQLISHAEEPDYPLFEEAAKAGFTGSTALARKLRMACGIPVKGATATPWEREINYCPVITLEEPVWRVIHGALGWVNRDHDIRSQAPCFWLWSNAANQVRFVMKQKAVVTDG